MCHECGATGVRITLSLCGKCSRLRQRWITGNTRPHEALTLAFAKFGSITKVMEQGFTYGECRAYLEECR